MGQLKVLIVEDKPLTAEDISYTLEEMGYEIIAVAHSGGAALEALERHKPDLVLLDIDLGEGMNGVAVGRIIHANYKMPFLYLTARSDKKTLDEAKETHPMAYILKPFTPNDLRAAIEIAMFNVEAGNAATFKQKEPEEAPGVVTGSQGFFVKSRGRYEKIGFEDILWVEADDTYSRVQTKEKQYMVSYTLKSMVERLEHPDIIRVHRSFMVNVSHVEAIEDFTLIIGNKLVPVSKSYRPTVMPRFSML